MGNRKPGNCVFALKCCMLFAIKHETQFLKYHLVRAEPPFTVKTIDWVHQMDLGKEHSILATPTGRIVHGPDQISVPSKVAKLQWYCFVVYINRSEIKYDSLSK